MIQQKAVGQLITIASLAAIAILTLTPVHGAQPSGVSICLVCGSYGATDVVLNILLFMPVGIGLRLAGVPTRRAILMAAATSLAIELVQIRVVVGRDASLGDLVSNSVGGWAGVHLGDRWRSWVFPAPQPARHRAVAAALLWLLLLAGSAWAARPSLPRLTYWGHWASTSGPGPLFDGSVVTAAVGHATLPWDPIANSGVVRRQLLAEHHPLQAVVVPGAPTTGLAPITRITDIRRRELVMLGQAGRDLVFHMRTRASDLRLRDPAVRITNVFPDSATIAAARAHHGSADTIRIAGAFTGQAYRVWATTAGRTRSRVLRPGPGVGWNFLVPFSYAAGGTARLVTALWLGLLVLPTAYWAARATIDARRRHSGHQRSTPPFGLRTATAATLVAGTIVVGLALVPPLCHDAPVHWSAWVACGASAAAGWAVGRASLGRHAGRAAAAANGASAGRQR